VSFSNNWGGGGVISLVFKALTLSCCETHVGQPDCRYIFEHKHQDNRGKLLDLPCLQQVAICLLISSTSSTLSAINLVILHRLYFASQALQ